MKLLQRAVEQSEKEYEHIRKLQITDVQNPDFGGYVNYDFGLVPQATGALAARPMTLYFCPQSRFYKSKEALACADMLVQHLLNHLHGDGTLDYFQCNFHSAPDTAFAVVALAKAAKLITAETKEEKAFRDKLYTALRRMGDGMVNGGFHTPNHRWVISAALSLINALMPDERYLRKIDQYLAEGIDCNEDGEYAERSAGGYNEINNRAMLILAQELDRPELLEHVRRNLELMYAFYHSDFSIFTENSTRQDKGTTLYADKYVYQYLICGDALGDESLRSAGAAILQSCMERGRDFPVALEDVLLFPGAFSAIPAPASAESFRVNRLFRESGLLRLSNGDLNLWALEKQPAFLFLKCGDIDLYIKGGISFFNCRHLTVENIRKSGDGYEMDYAGSGQYYLPFGEHQGTSDWWAMDKEKRETMGHLSVKAGITVTPAGEGFDIRVKTEGCPNATIRFEIGVIPNVKVFGPSYQITATPGANVIATGGDVTLFDGNDIVVIGPAFAANGMTKGLFGAVQPSEHRFNIFFNDVTNFDRTFSVRAKEQLANGIPSTLE